MFNTFQLAFPNEYVISFEAVNPLSILILSSTAFTNFLYALVLESP